MKLLKYCIMMSIVTLYLTGFVCSVWAIDIKGQPFVIATFKVEVSDARMFYLDSERLFAKLIKLNSSANIEDKQVDFFIDDKFVGSGNTRTVGWADYSISSQQSRQLNLQIGQHKVRAQVMDNVNNMVVKAYGTLTVSQARATLSDPTQSGRIKEYYTLGETITLTGSLYHSRYPEEDPNPSSSGGGYRGGGLIREIPTGKPGASSSSSSPSYPYSPLPITNAEIDCGHNVKVRTNNQGKFECLIILTESILEYTKEPSCKHLGSYSGRFYFNFRGNDKYRATRTFLTPFRITACPLGTVYRYPCCDPK